MNILKEERNDLWTLDKNGEPLNVPCNLVNHACRGGHCQQSHKFKTRHFVIVNVNVRLPGAPPQMAPQLLTRVPALPAFSASKTATWADRHASRDLWGLWALNRLGAIDAAAEDLYRRYGPTNQPPARTTSRRRPQRPDGRTSSPAKLASRSHRAMPWLPCRTLGHRSAGS